MALFPGPKTKRLLTRVWELLDNYIVEQFRDGIEESLLRILDEFGIDIEK